MFQHLNVRHRCQESCHHEHTTLACDHKMRAAISCTLVLAVAAFANDMKFQDPNSVRASAFSCPWHCKMREWVIGVALTLSDSTAMGELQENPNEPPEMTRELWCAACHGAIREAAKRMPPPHLINEAEVFSAFAKVDDDPFRFSSYSFTPPTMRFAVGRFLDEFEEIIDPRGAWPTGSSLEDAFITLHDRKIHPESAICEPLCKGVDFLSPDDRDEQILEMQRKHRQMLASKRRQMQKDAAGGAAVVDDARMQELEQELGGPAGAKEREETRKRREALARQQEEAAKHAYAGRSAGAEAGGVASKSRVAGRVSDAKTDKLTQAKQDMEKNVEEQLQAEQAFQKRLERSRSVRKRAELAAKAAREARLDL